MNNHVFLIAGPSGVGKNYAVSKVLEAFDSCVGIPTYTTRPQRADDLKSKSRICIDNQTFLKLIKNDELVEYKEFDRYFYGKKRSDFEEAFKDKKNVIIEIDVQGLEDYKREFGKDLTTIFLSYESLGAIENRILSNRPDATKEDVERRTAIALEEMKQKDKYEYQILNIENHPEIAVEKIFNIIKKKVNNEILP